MELDKKRILALVGLVCATLIFGFLIYKLFFAPTEEEQQQTATEETRGKLSTSQTGEGGERATEELSEEVILPTAADVAPFADGGSKVVAVTTLTSSPNNGATLSADGSGMQFYNKLDGKFYRVDDEGNMVPLSNETFPAVQNVTWAPNKGLAALEFPDGNKVIYNFNEQKQYSIPQHWNDLQFAPDSSQIAGTTASPDPQLRYLFTARTDGTGAVPVQPLGENGNKVIVNWSPNDQVVAFSKTAAPLGGGIDRQGVLLIGKNNENFKQLTVEGLGFEPQWSPTGDRVLYSVFNKSSDLGPTLWVDGGGNDTVGAAKNYLSINTWAHKCTFATTDEVICAVPNPDKLIPGIGFAPQLANDTDDTIYKVNIKTGLQTIIAKPDGNRTIDQVSLSKDGSMLFMKDKASGELLKMRLK